MANMSRLNVTTTTKSLQELDYFQHYSKKARYQLTLSGGMKNLENTGSVLMGDFSADASLKLERRLLDWILQFSWQNQSIGTELPALSDGTIPTGTYSENAFSLKTWLPFKFGGNFLRITPTFGFNFYANNDTDQFSNEALRKRDINFDLGLAAGVWNVDLGYQARNILNIDTANPGNRASYANHQINLGYNHKGAWLFGGLLRIVPQDSSETDVGLYARINSPQSRLAYYSSYQFRRSLLDIGLDWQPTRFMEVPFRVTIPMPGAPSWETGMSWGASIKFYFDPNVRRNTPKPSTSTKPASSPQQNAGEELPIDIQF